MRIVAWLVVAVAVLSAPRLARAFALDEVDALFAGDTHETLVSQETVDAAQTAASTAPKAAAADGKRPWNSAAAGSAAKPGELSEQPSTIETHDAKPVPSLPINPVPEPSAVALAGLALLYFLLFGRRTRLG